MIGGTKWPSITSTWITRAPASITSATWAPSCEKSAERIDGATWRSPEEVAGGHRALTPGASIEWPQCWQSMSCEVLIRTIVWCSPQLGHWETSS